MSLLHLAQKNYSQIYQKDSFETHLHGCAKAGSGSRSRQHVLNGAPTMQNGRNNGLGVFSPLSRPDKTVHTTSDNTRHVWLLRLPRNLDIHTTCTLRSKVLGHANTIQRPLEWPPSHSSSHADGCKLGAVDILLIYLRIPSLIHRGTLAQFTPWRRKGPKKENAKRKREGQQRGEKPNKRKKVSQKQISKAIET